MCSGIKCRFLSLETSEKIGFFALEKLNIGPFQGVKSGIIPSKTSTSRGPTPNPPQIQIHGYTLSLMVSTYSLLLLLQPKVNRRLDPFTSFNQKSIGDLTPLYSQHIPQRSFSPCLPVFFVWPNWVENRIFTLYHFTDKSQEKRGPAGRPLISLSHALNC